MMTERMDLDHKVKVTILASEWGSGNGRLSTINRELAIQLAKSPKAEITFFLPKCSQEDRKIALEHKVKIVEATPLPGFEQLNWLCFPPEDLHIDIIVGHGVKLGKQAQVIKNSKNCKWVQVVHTDPEELGMFKSYSNPISKGEEKHKTEVELCKMADRVVGVGPKLSEAFRSYLCGCNKDGNVFEFTPGVFEEFKDVRQASSQRQRRNVLVFGGGDVEDFELKGFDIAGKAIAALQDTRLVFVGTPDGKYEEVKNRFIRCGVPTNRLRVRGFVEDRESLRSLFQEVDLVVMPSRTEGFGLTGLEAMSAGLPVLVSSNSGFGKALCSAAFGSSFVIESEDPAIWTVAIQNIWSKDRECRLEEAVTLRDSYGRKYNWAKQINDLVDRMISLAHEPLMENDNNPRTNSYEDERLKADATPGNQTETATVKESQSQNSRKRKMSESSCDPGAIVKVLKLIISAPDLSDEQQENLDDILKVHASKYLIHHSPSTPEGLSAFFEHLVEVHNVSVKSVQKGSLIITVECPTLESLERLWNDYQSGCLNDIAESYLVTDELKRKLGLDHVRLRITIEEENYLICQKALMEISGVSGITEISQTVDSAQEENTRRSETSSEVVKDKKQVLTPMARAEKAKASRGLLHKAVISGQYKTVKILLECGEDVDQGDQSSLTPLHLACWYGQETVVKLLLKHGANVNAEDVFQRTPLQIAEHQNHHSIVQLLQKNDSRPSLDQPDKKLVLSHMERAKKAKVSRGPLHKAAIRGEYRMVKIRVECGEDVDQKDQFSQTPLHLACWYGQESVVKLLLKHGANVKAEDKFQRTPLQNAERQNHHSIVQLLRKNDARLSLHQPDKTQVLTHQEGAETAKASKGSLHRAAVSGQHETVKELLESGEDVYQSDEMSPLPRPDRRPSHSGSESPKEREEESQDKKQVLTPMARAEKAKASRGPLHKAAISGQYETVKMLLESGEDVDQRDQFSLTSLHLACWYGQESVVKLLLEHGANVNAEDRFQRTPLQKAERQNHHSIVQLLQKNDARLSLHQPDTTVETQGALTEDSEEDAEVNEQMAELASEEDLGAGYLGGWNEKSDDDTETEDDAKGEKVIEVQPGAVVTSEGTSRALKKWDYFRYSPIFVRPRPAVFFAYFRPENSNILCLICCPAHLKGQVVKKLKKKGVTPICQNSKKDLIPGHDKVFVSVSEGICPYVKRDMEEIHLRFLEDHPDDEELEVRFLSGKYVARVEFYSILEARARPLCRLHLSMPNQGTKQPGALMEGIPTDDVLERLSTKLSIELGTLGRLLQFRESKLQEFDKYHEKISEKAYAMLLYWKQRDGSDATYRVLNEALCDTLVNRRDLAQEFCCH